MAIKSFELEPTRENLLNTLTKNLLDRNKSVWQFARFCDAQDGKCSIAIDAKWGQGKTFFVKHVQLLLDSFNEFSTSVSTEERESIKSAFSEYIGSGENAVELEQQVCVYYDAWANDNDSDPILSLVYEIIKGAAQHYSLKKDVDFIKAAATIADFFTGKNAADIVALAQERDLLSELKSQKEIHDIVADFLESLLYEQGDRLVVFVDELDRCKPSYAVQLLERIKHYFANDRITFVFSINADELQHTIKCFYGEGFDSCRYLDRFFDYRIALPPANMTRYYQEIGLNSGHWVYDAVCKAVIETFSLELREAEKFYRMAKIAADKAVYIQALSGFPDENALRFSLCIVVPIIIGLRMTDMALYNDFIAGRNPQPLIDVMGDGRFARGICATLLDRDETFDEDQEERETVLLSDKLRAAYRALFDDSIKTNWGEAHVGGCSFSRETKDTTLRATSLLSEFANYE